MEFQTLRKSHKKEIIIGALAICVIGGALTFATTKAKYKLTESIDLVKGTINYKPYDFKIMAMYRENDRGDYTEITDRMPSEGYKINESKSYCTLDNKNHDTTAKLYTNSAGEHVFQNLAKSDKCYLYFDKKTPENIPEIIAAVNPKTTTPDFGQIATTDEGVYSVSDGMYGGTSYYWRGAVTNNYVKFANFCWRIVRINGDKTMRLIYDGTTCHANGTSTLESIAKTSQTYNPSYDRSEYVGWTYSTGSQRTTSGTASNAKNQTDSWYSSNITGTNATKVADGKFCNDRNTASGYSWSSQPSSTFYYAAYGRLKTNKTPTFVCPSGDTYTIKAGLITADEIAMAGGKWENKNSNYYLYNGQWYWTTSPSKWNGGDAYIFIVRSDGSMNDGYAGGANSGLRPVINLRSDVTFTSGGTGTQTNPYVVQ